MTPHRELVPTGKSLFATKTFWGVLIAALPTAAAAVLRVVGTATANPALISIAEMLEQIGQATVVPGSALALYGRATATEKVSTAVPPKQG